MKDYHIYFFENLGELNKTIGFINIKEKFINNSFENEAHVLLDLSEDFTHRKEIPLSIIKKNLIKGQGLTVPQYSNKYANQIKNINKYIDSSNDVLSWLDIFQIAALVEDNSDDIDAIRMAINKILKFKTIINEKY